MVDKVLQVLETENMGKKLHADEINKIYGEEIDRHRSCCETCCEGMVQINHCCVSWAIINACNL